MKLSSQYFSTGHTLSDFYSVCENKYHVKKTSSLKLSKEHLSSEATLRTLPVPRGGGGGGSSRPPKGFSWITFDQNNLETSNFA